MNSHWDLHASQWSNIGSPLRPSCVDIRTFSSWLSKITISSIHPFNVLILGATSEFVEISWPKNTHLYAIDSNFAMMKLFSRKKEQPFQSIKYVGNWLKLPFPDSIIHLVLGDGCYSMLSETNYDTLSKEIIRVLRPTGYFFMRFFVRPKYGESIKLIQKNFLSGEIGNFHVLKWRIAMALHGSLQRGVCLNDIWNAWHEHFEIYTNQLIWSKSVINTINVYKDNFSFYTFPTFQELNLKLSTHFQLIERFIPKYTLGNRCPIISLKPLRALSI